MTVYIRAEEVTVDTDEGRFVLRVLDVDGTEATIDIHPFAIEFYDQVRSVIGEYAAEAQIARLEVQAGIPQPVTNRPMSVEDAINAGYALDDPKSPGWHDRMSDLSDDQAV